MFEGEVWMSDLALNFHCTASVFDHKCSTSGFYLSIQLLKPLVFL